MICPKGTPGLERLDLNIGFETQYFRPGASPAVHESNENSPFVTPGVRVQTVNVNQVVENCVTVLEKSP